MEFSARRIMATVGQKLEALQNGFFTTSGSNIFAVSSQTTYAGLTMYAYRASEAGHKTVVCRSTDNGSSWEQVYSGYLDHGARISSFVKNSNGILFAAGTWYPATPSASSLFSIVLTSDCDGRDWKTAYIDSNTQAPLLGTHSSEVYMRTNGELGHEISRFHDDGDSWERLNPIIAPFGIIDEIYSYSTRFSTFAADANKIYMAGWGRHIAPSDHGPSISFHYDLLTFSTDHGQNWTRVASPLDSLTKITNDPSDTVSTITKIYPDGDHILIGTCSLNFSQPLWYPANGGGFYHLYFDGSEWSVSDTAFTDQSVFGFAANGSTIFAATENGVFSTRDYGANWKDIRTGMGNLCARELFVTDTHLFAWTNNGLWTRPLSQITSVDWHETNEPHPQNFSLSQNYPNPFNPSTIIRYQLAKDSRVSIKVFDILGREVATLVNAFRPAGSYRVNFDAAVCRTEFISIKS
jgi:hypothetical protein